MTHKKEINWEMVELYVKSGCKQIDICRKFFIDEETLRSRVKKKYGLTWSAFSASLQSEGDMLILAQQFQKAMKGNWQALHWLGKVRLGQKEPETTMTLAPNQAQLDQSHRIMELEYQLAELRENGNKSKTE